MARIRLTQSKRNEVIRGFILRLVYGLFFKFKTELKVKGVSNSFWTNAKKLGYIVKNDEGLYQPTVQFTDEIISEIDGICNVYTNGTTEEEPETPDLFTATPEPVIEEFPTLSAAESGLTKVLICLKQMTLIVPKELKDKIKINIEFV